MIFESNAGFRLPVVPSRIIPERAGSAKAELLPQYKAALVVITSKGKDLMKRILYCMLKVGCAPQPININFCVLDTECCR